MTEHLSARSRLVHDALRAAGIPGEIVVLPDAASTAVLAAEALGSRSGPSRTASCSSATGCRCWS